MQNRRDFLRVGSLASTALLSGCRTGRLTRRNSSAPSAIGKSPVQTASDEPFWKEVRRAFDLERGLINLNHGLSPAPRVVQQTLVAELNRVNRAPVLHQHDAISERRREDARAAAARALGCTPEELALTRSGTESLQIVQLGIELEAGDEVLSTREDYWAMWSTWQQRVEREGIVYREIDLGGPYPPPEEIVSRFEQAFTPRTRVVLFCHMTWRTGHVLPVRDICAAARSRGIQTIVDGAHAFGHIPVRVSELDCDYYGTSGHKWLQAPLGTGLLYVRRERIADLWPPPASWNVGERRESIRKFEVVGSETPAFDIAIADAVRFLEGIGVERKTERLRYLTQRWTSQLGSHERLRIVTDLSPGRSCGIGAFYIDGLESTAIADHLLDRYHIFVGAPSEEAWSGPPLVRVTPNVFTSADEIDTFVDAVKEIMRSGLR